MVPSTVEDFYDSIPDVEDLSKSELADYFLYLVTVVEGRPRASRDMIDACFDACGIDRLTRLPAYLNEASRGQRKKLLRDEDGFKLERRRKAEIASKLAGAEPKRKVRTTLRAIEQQLPGGARREFLGETISCFEIGAYRAAVVMAWLLTLDVLFEFILANKLSDFNQALSRHPDKKINSLVIRGKDNFSDIPEGQFIELGRSSGVYNNDIRKILNEKLGIRNSCAHPSTVKVPESKALEFIEDLTHNVIVRFS